MKEKYIKGLINISKTIYSCYQELITIELGHKKNKITDMKKVYDKIREYRALEDYMFHELKNCCYSKNDVSFILTNLYNTYQIEEEPIFQGGGYLRNLSFLIEIRRVVNRIQKDISLIEPTPFYKEDTEELEEENYNSCYDDSAVIDEQAILSSLLEEEDTIRFINKIHNFIHNYNSKKIKLSKKQLLKLKYDMFFLSPLAEATLIEEYKIPPLLFCNAKERAAVLYHFTDSQMEEAYDLCREYDILEQVTEISQKRNQGSIQNEIRYMIIDMWAETVSDEKLSEILGKIEDSAYNAYNDEIKNLWHQIYERLYEKYYERVKDYEVVEELGEIEEEKNPNSNQKVKKEILQ